MLASKQRLRRSADFAAVTKHGRRRKSGGLVVYLLPAAVARAGDGRAAANSGGARAGLIVGKTVGNSVVRHRVSRRLRAQLSAEIGQLGVGDQVVVRALTGAEYRTSEQLGRDLGEALRHLRRANRVPA